MKHSALTAAAVAAGTMAIALAAFWPHGIVAKGISQNGLPAQIKTPLLKVSGCELALRPTQKTYQPGAMPEAELTVVNTTNREVSLTPTLRMTTLASGGGRGRRMPIPSEVWMDCPPVTVEPGQTRVLRFQTHTKVAAAQTLGFTVSVGKKTMRTAGATVPAPAKAPTPEQVAAIAK